MCDAHQGTYPEVDLAENLSDDEVFCLHEDNKHNNVLMCTAIGLNGVPDTCTFFTHFYERKHLFSIEEKVQGLEVLGSTHILRQEFKVGLKCWKKAASLRATPRTPLPLFDRPPVSSKLFRAEWTTLKDLTRLSLPRHAARVTENADQETFDARFELTYQAMLIRLRYCKSNSRPDVLTLCESIGHLVPNSAGVLFVKFGLFLLEWDELYARHSLSFDDHIGPSSIVDEYFLVELVKLSSTCHSDIICFENLMVLLKWSATEMERRRLSLDQQFFSIDAVYCAVQTIGIMVIQNLLSDEDVEFRTCLKRMVVADDNNFQNLLLSFCVSMRYTFGPLLSLNETELFLMRKKVLRLLIEAGADINSVDKYGENCLHSFVNEKFEESTENCLPMFRLLLDCGARWDSASIRRPAALEVYQDKLTQGFQAILGSDGFFSLQWLCVRIIRSKKIRISDANKAVPRAIVDMINDY